MMKILTWTTIARCWVDGRGLDGMRFGGRRWSGVAKDKADKVIYINSILGYTDLNTPLNSRGPCSPWFKYEKQQGEIFVWTTSIFQGGDSVNGKPYIGKRNERVRHFFLMRKRTKSLSV